MKKYKSKIKNTAYFGYRIINPIFDPVKLIKGFYGYLWYVRDLIKFMIMNKKIDIKIIDLYPVLSEKVRETYVDTHYFYQQLWLFENVLENKPKKHVDVGSTYQMSGYLSKIVPTTFVDIRLIDVKLKNLTVVNASLLHLPYKENSIESISCLSVIEHIGLGRYGDEIDPDGWKKACKELQRVLAKNGKLYLSVPIGKPRVCFNAHRVFSPGAIVSIFDRLKLKEFDVVDDEGNFIMCQNINDFDNQDYACGLYLFEKD